VPCSRTTGADAFSDVVAAAVLEDDRFDALELQQMGKHEARGPAPMMATCVSTVLSSVKVARSEWITMGDRRAPSPHCSS